jgi:transcription elongation factor Elf1
MAKKVGKISKARARALLTEEQARAYMTSTYSSCPSCKSQDLYVGPVEAVDANQVRVVLDCHACGARWQDVYRLSALEVLDEDDKVVQGFDAPAPGVLIEISDGQLSYANADGNVELVTVDWDAVEEETNPKTLQALIADVEALPPGCDEDGVILETLQGRLAKLRDGKGA